jgi:hypothetical protein
LIKLAVDLRSSLCDNSLYYEGESTWHVNH